MTETLSLKKEEPARKPIQFEYNVRFWSDGTGISINTELATAGNEGWELVGLGQQGPKGYMLVYKRRKQS